MEYGQVIANGLMLGAIYACIAVGFSLVWGVLNVINMMHGSFIILGGYLTFFAWLHLKINSSVQHHVMMAISGSQAWLIFSNLNLIFR